MSAADDILGFEQQLRRLIEEAVESAEQFELDGEWRKDGIPVNRCAYVLGYIMGPAQFTPTERAALDGRIHGRSVLSRQRRAAMSERHTTRQTEALKQMIAKRRRVAMSGGWLRRMPNGRPCRLYRIWTGMLYRCNCHTADEYDDYGGRGISVGGDWCDYSQFRAWAIANGYRKDLTLDRIDNDGNYEHGNCRWATRSEQQRNKKCTVLLGNKVAFEVAVKNGINLFTFHSRLRCGWSAERAATTPARHYNRSEQ